MSTDDQLAAQVPQYIRKHTYMRRIGVLKGTQDFDLYRFVIRGDSGMGYTRQYSALACWAKLQAWAERKGSACALIRNYYETSGPNGYLVVELSDPGARLLEAAIKVDGDAQRKAQADNRRYRHTQ